jgi:GxxExxY protein
VDHQALTRTIIGCAMRVHGALGPGFLESVYQNALVRELRDVLVEVECGRRLEVRYRGEVVGEFVADMVVDGRVMVENKAVAALAAAHDAQLMNYLAATTIGVGLLLNFGAERLEVRRRTWEYGLGARGRVGKSVQDEGRMNGRMRAG